MTCYSISDLLETITMPVSDLPDTMAKPVAAMLQHGGPTRHIHNSRCHSMEDLPDTSTILDATAWRTYLTHPQFSMPQHGGPTRHIHNSRCYSMEDLSDTSKF
ncbi:hypothetical protein PoB_007544100 [Plakobranchus ocellatus]|uniref:Uncharacterized protein n=1 Tax=Plakobranchus ocellatus TaxID=259542 RepID=A0AAV4DXW3_9GAST|nr:hypothetical protein PoB_007544100 [Plakobranchus ocellatus]